MTPGAKIIIGDSRSLAEVEDGAIDLVVTSPPYWHLKDYGSRGQTGFGQSLHAYLRDLHLTWRECFRVLRPGSRLCLNIGDQFARAAVYGRYKIIPIHAELIAQCEELGFDFMGAIIWQKKTTMNTSGGANIMGSYPYPPNGLIEIDYEFILIFKKPGPPRKVGSEIKDAARLSKEEWKEYFAGHWQFGGARKLCHEARFPEELPRRLIRMFTFPGDTVLDPFLGSGTTARAALDLGRRVVGYEINVAYLGLIQENIGWTCRSDDMQILQRANLDLELPVLAYEPRIKAAVAPAATGKAGVPGEPCHKVVAIEAAAELRIDSGQTVSFLGVKVVQPQPVVQYLTRSLLGKSVILKFDGNTPLDRRTISAYVYLKNRIFINAYLLKSGLALADPEVSHRLRSKFVRWAAGAPQTDAGGKE